jgi:hypothetical protein
MVLTFPYHDPGGMYNDLLRKNIPFLEKFFDVICISVTPQTVSQNPELLEYLANHTKIQLNKEESNIGDHFRNALKIAIDNKQNDSIFFGFIDRVIFDLETQWKKKFLNDLAKHKNEQFLLFERSEAAWGTHPNNYREIEQMVSRCFKFLSGMDIELNPCGLILSQESAKKILNESQSQLWDVWGEWILIALKNKLGVKTKKVDWLSWEDPFWEKKEPNKFKVERENSKEETIKRIKSNLPFFSLITEERFNHKN